MFTRSDSGDVERISRPRSCCRANYACQHGERSCFPPFSTREVQMPPTPLKARARGLRTLAIAWVRGVLGCNDFSAGATKHAWRTSPSPWPPSSPLEERKGDGFPAPFLSPLSAPPRGAEVPAPVLAPLSAPPRRAEGGTWGAGANERWQPLTQWSHRFGTCPVSNAGF